VIMPIIGRSRGVNNTFAKSQVFQVLILNGENDGDKESLRDARNLTITDEEFKSFLERHANQECLVPEDNQSMKDSYLCLDEEMR
jgi:radical S-adenosyl methionine domain-containing protein 2